MELLDAAGISIALRTDAVSNVGYSTTMPSRRLDVPLLNHARQPGTGNCSVSQYGSVNDHITTSPNLNCQLPDRPYNQRIRHTGSAEKMCSRKTCSGHCFCTVKLAPGEENQRIINVRRSERKLEFTHQSLLYTTPHHNTPPPARDPIVTSGCLGTSPF